MFDCFLVVSTLQILYVQNKYFLLIIKCNFAGHYLHQAVWKQAVVSILIPCQCLSPDRQSTFKSFKTNNTPPLFKIRFHLGVQREANAFCFKFNMNSVFNSPWREEQRPGWNGNDVRRCCSNTPKEPLITDKVTNIHQGFSWCLYFITHFNLTLTLITLIVMSATTPGRQTTTFYKSPYYLFPFQYATHNNYI